LTKNKKGGIYFPLFYFINLRLTCIKSWFYI
jgi:hypothetical protein